MQAWQSVVLGIVEGVTEFLPISSTGHLILSAELMGLPDSDFAKAFEIIIQAGAIFAVVVVYRKKLLHLAAGLLRGQRNAWRSALGVAIGTAPAVLLALLFGKWIKAHLFGVWPVIGALAVGGVLIVLVERFLPLRRHLPPTGDFEVPSPGRAFVIGLCQCLALWPGTSRSMATILGGRLVGLSAPVAAEFSFLLAIPVLFGACAHDLWKSREILAASPELGLHLALGLVTSFLVAWAVVTYFLRYLAKHTLEAFGWYRIAVALALWAWYIR